MIKSIVSPAFIIFLTLFSCSNNKEIERLKFENDSLRSELAVRNDMEAAMRDVKSLLDSIDINRKNLRVDLGEGIAYAAFASRLHDIKDYVASTEQRISKVEKQLSSSNRNANSYMVMLNALRTELSIRMEEVASLETDVLNYKKENEGLVSQVTLQQNEISQIKQSAAEEITKLDAKVKEMGNTARLAEADAYYTQARTIEETANRTRLAPRKKKETYREALELYKKAFSLGKTEAQESITRLESKLK
jgi:predicted  nucleic acid-binding Zn-ribbon protein